MQKISKELLNRGQALNSLNNEILNYKNDISSKNVSVVGKNNILKHQEFSNVEKVEDLFSKLDDIEVLQNIEEDNNDINVYIGHENKMDPDVTVIKTNYHTNQYLISYIY